ALEVEGEIVDIQTIGPTIRDGRGEIDGIEPYRTRGVIYAITRGRFGVPELASVEDKIDEGTAEPELDAHAAGARGDFGLILTGDGNMAAIVPVGVECHTTDKRVPRTKVRLPIGDAVGPREARWLDYALSYNTTLVSLPEYPDADLCR